MNVEGEKETVRRKKWRERKRNEKEKAGEQEQSTFYISQCKQIQVNKYTCE